MHCIEIHTISLKITKASYLLCFFIKNRASVFFLKITDQNFISIETSTRISESPLTVCQPQLVTGAIHPHIPHCLLCVLLYYITAPGF